ncbi:AAA family ATPase [Actinosynnema sp. NPDC059335]|uniref:helix-turn-helix transcriptional regulator n=1 Tax=Actinosynnema sp. NPDC059335 TaxID=3346804 RepID=UPI003672D708
MRDAYSFPRCICARAIRSFPPTTGNRGAGVLVGRQGEMTAARAALAESARSRRCAVVEVVGEPGVGKSSRVAAVLAEAAGDGVVAVHARAGDHGAGPFGALVEALDDLVAERDGRLRALSGDDRAVLAEIFPALRGTGPARAERHRVHRALRALLERLSGSRGLVLALDDMHWADSALVEFLAYLVRQPPQARLVVLVAYRPRQVDPRLTAALAEGRVGVRRLDLAPLTRAQVAELLGPGVAPARAAALHEASGGNPLYLRALAGSGLPTGTPLHAVLLAEFAGLSPLARRVARTAAVVGDPFDADLVAAVAGLDHDAITGALDEAHRRDVVRPHGLSRFVFRHDVLRQVIYDSTAASRRRDAHARAAEALRRRGASPAARAGHVARSAAVGDRDAVELLRRAADDLRWHAPGVAATYLREALALLPAADPAEHGLRIRLAGCVAADGRPHDAREVVDRVLHGLPAGDRRRPPAVALAGTIERLLGHHTRARALLRRELDAVADPVVAADLQLELGMIAILAGDFTADRDLVEHAHRTACAAGDLPLRAHSAALIALADYVTGAIDAARSGVTAAAALVDSLPDRTLTTQLEACVHLGWTEMFLERFHDALGHFDRGLRLARTSGQEYLLPFLLAGIACDHQWLGELDLAARFAEDAVATAELSGSDELRTMTYTLQALVANRQGDVDLARRAGERAVTAAGRDRDWWAATAAIVHGEARLNAGDDPAECLRAVADAAGGPDLAAVDPGHRPNWYQVFFYTALGVGDLDAARSWLDRMAAASAGLDAVLPCRAALVRLARGHLLLARDRPGPALDHARAAAAVFADADDRLDLGRAHLLAGLALTAAGRRAEAVAELDRARATFATAGAHRLHDEAVRGLRRLGHRVAGRPSAQRPDDELTRREAEIADLIADGLTNAKIAQRLVLSVRTVDAHVRNIFTKLGVTSRAAVAAYAINRRAA